MSIDPGSLEIVPYPILADLPLYLWGPVAYLCASLTYRMAVHWGGLEDAVLLRSSACCSLWIVCCFAFFGCLLFPFCRSLPLSGTPRRPWAQPGPPPAAGPALPRRGRPGPGHGGAVRARPAPHGVGPRHELAAGVVGGLCRAPRGRPGQGGTDACGMVGGVWTICLSGSVAFIKVPPPG